MFAKEQIWARCSSLVYEKNPETNITLGLHIEFCLTLHPQLLQSTNNADKMFYAITNSAKKLPQAMGTY